MNATELFHKEGRPAGVHFYSDCRTVYRTVESADRCCTPIKCIRCGVMTGTKSYYCGNTCLEEARFEKARKIPEDEWEGWVYSDGTGFDGYSENMEELRESLELDEEPPDYVWACKEKRFAVLDPERILASFCDYAYEGFELEDLNGLPELNEAIEQFNEANKDVIAYTPDYSLAILLKGID